MALNRPGERAASRLARLNSMDFWHVTDRGRFVGSAGALTEFLAGLAAHVDGVLFHPAEAAVDFPILAADVLPALTASGRGRVPGPDNTTLRDVLGLPRPASRFAGPARAADRTHATDPARSAASA